MNEYLVGIDIGFSKVCAAAGRLDKYGHIQIIGITSVKSNGLKQSVVVDIDSVASSIKECIEQLKRMIDIDINNVYISLPGEVSELIYNKGIVAISSENREIKENDVNRALEASKLITLSSDKQIVGTIPLQYIVDGYENIKDPVGMNGFRLEVESQVILTNVTIINNLLKSVKKAGLNVAGIVLQPLAIWETVFDKEQVDLNSVIVDVGAENTVVSVFRRGVLLGSHLIPLGGNNISNDISLCLKIPYLEGEKLKLKYGNLDESENDEVKKIKVNSQYGDNIEIDYVILNKIIKARVEEILLLIKKKLTELDNYEEISEIVLVGGGISLFYGVEKLARELLEKPVRIGTPEFTGANNPLYATVVGMVQDVAYNLKDTKVMGNDDYENDKANINKKENGFLSKIHEFFTDFF